MNIEEELRPLPQFISEDKVESELDENVSIYSWSKKEGLREVRE